MGFHICLVLVYWVLLKHFHSTMVLVLGSRLGFGWCEESIYDIHEIRNGIKLVQGRYYLSSQLGGCCDLKSLIPMSIYKAQACIAVQPLVHTLQWKRSVYDANMGWYIMDHNELWIADLTTTREAGLAFDSQPWHWVECDVMIAHTTTILSI